MAIFRFDDITDQSIRFDVNADILSLSGKASDYAISEDETGNATISRGDKTLILTSANVKTLITANFLVADAVDVILIGDNARSVVDDDLAQASGDALDLAGTSSAALDGDNLIYGQGGGDTITTGNGDNLIYGGRGPVDSVDGSDTIIIDGNVGSTSGSNTIFANAGDDTILFTDPTGAGKETKLYGGLGNDDVLTGEALGSLTLYGNAGDDTINASTSRGSTVIFGGDGVVDSVDGADVLFSGFGATTVYGNAGSDNISFDDFTSGVTQFIYGGLGDDTVQGDANGAGAQGSLQIYGNAGSDVIDVTDAAGATTVFGGDGFVDSTDGADAIAIGGAAGGSYSIYGNAGADTFIAGAAMADNAAATIYGGLGADEFNVSGARGDGSTLVLHGNEDADIFNINDAALTENAKTTFVAFEEKDTINLTVNGGTATDFEVTGLGASAVLTNKVAHGVYTFSNYEGNFSATNLVLSDGSAIVTNAGDTASSLAGTANNDLLIAGKAGDTLSGAAGDDIIRGGDSGDSIDGGDGVDTIFGNEGNDTITAGAGGADGGAADSVIDGGDGADSITGGDFEDSIMGGNGHDTLVGGADVDTLTGGLGNDVYSYAVAETDASDANVDQITDAFVSGLDQFDFSDLDNATLRGTGTDFAKGTADSAQTLGANVGLYVATNNTSSFSEATIYSELSGIADDLAVGDALYVLASNGTDGRLMKVTNTANAGLNATDDSLEFVSRLDGVSTADLSALSAGNFVDFS